MKKLFTWLINFFRKISIYRQIDHDYLIVNFRGEYEVLTNGIVKYCIHPLAAHPSGSFEQRQQHMRPDEVPVSKLGYVDPLWLPNWFMDRLVWYGFQGVVYRYIGITFATLTIISFVILTIAAPESMFLPAIAWAGAQLGVAICALILFAVDVTLIVGLISFTGSQGTSSLPASANMFGASVVMMVMFFSILGWYVIYNFFV